MVRSQGVTDLVAECELIGAFVRAGSVVHTGHEARVQAHLNAVHGRPLLTHTTNSASCRRYPGQTERAVAKVTRRKCKRETVVVVVILRNVV